MSEKINPDSYDSGNTSNNHVLFFESIVSERLKVSDKEIKNTYFQQS